MFLDICNIDQTSCFVGVHDWCPGVCRVCETKLLLQAQILFLFQKSKRQLETHKRRLPLRKSWYKWVVLLSVTQVELSAGV